MFTRQIKKQLGMGGGRISERENTLANLASGYLIFLAKSEFRSHLASWRVVIRTPASKYSKTCG
jgi:hypothetical protein